MSGFDAGKLGELLGSDLAGELTRTFAQMEWAEEEIEKARRRHRAHSDRIYHSFSLLTPTHERMATEMVYRSHCRELLERVAASQDTRPGTAAEVCVVCCESSMLAPLTETAAGLYGRMWKAAGFPGHQWEDRQEHHEALSASLIDDAERETRRKLTVADRKLGDIECCGMHHGDEVTCQYAKAAKPEQLELAVA